ncbi:MAG: T9SS type A sorting domain-containing protein [Candidatus Zixiibacteriota bacterium]|nr:MAG: T9SS type A sorting domain-containing protein [candidate division Zixibacteria bacterium]
MAASLEHKTLIATSRSSRDPGLLPLTYQLQQNYPTPFNPSTSIHFSIPRHGRVRIDVFNLLGQSVTTLIDKEIDAGVHSVSWDGRNAAGTEAANGIYFYRLEAGEFTATRKMMMIK